MSKAKKKRKSEQNNKICAEWLRKAGFLQTDDLGTLDYNNDVSLDDLKTIDFNNDTRMTDLTDIDKINLKKISVTEQAAKKIIKKYRNLKIKGEPIKYSEPNKKSKSRNNDIMFVRQIPRHLRDRLKS